MDFRTVISFNGGSAIDDSGQVGSKVVAIRYDVDVFAEYANSSVCTVGRQPQATMTEPAESLCACRMYFRLLAEAV